MKAGKETLTSSFKVEFIKQTLRSVLSRNDGKVDCGIVMLRQEASHSLRTKPRIAPATALLFRIINL
jgi:hypothetical protein